MAPIPRTAGAVPASSLPSQSLLTRRRLPHILPHPLEISRKAILSGYLDDFRHFVRMQRFEACLHFRVASRRRFENHHAFGGLFHCAFPPVNGFYRRDDISAGGEIFLHQYPGNLTRFLRIGERAKNEDNVRLLHGIKQLPQDRLSERSLFAVRSSRRLLPRRRDSKLPPDQG